MKSGREIFGGTVHAPYVLPVLGDKRELKKRLGTVSATLSKVRTHKHQYHNSSYVVEPYQESRQSRWK